MNQDQRDILYDQDDVQITRQELATVQDGMCIGDMIVHFHFRCLERRYKENENYFYNFAPCTVQFIQTYPEFAKDSFTHLKLESYKFIFFALSDFTVERMAASHWSLLYIDNSKGEMKLKHFDSMNQCNLGAAKNFVTKLSQVFDLKSTKIEPLKCVSQPNCYDCGVYVMAYLDAFLQTNDHEESNKQLKPDLIYQYRKYMRDYINECIECQKKQFHL
ncbi:hypothetical protein TRFO_05961 [Tritrichomonas foetus]|uniref:Ubiquitin-like protease family profile domain-containing protein n=1 Tax=Tritrichomonas foetus TaxID=1144522 RepID=A0A1J4K3G4_9EUKA|nr:hypothetical protein TRFO_05961 [Tritrichomonas foetus]|eukprot:OHT05376.1 hypothetical protein TRFO_05961 [Tritrichomonas foetus]